MAFCLSVTVLGDDGLGLKCDMLFLGWFELVLWVGGGLAILDSCGLV